jgi:antitoxin component of RelBE/YafQ-DinJ toxin-antitoxin module
VVIKTFNVEESVYEKFLQFCKENGISMSKQIEMFMKSRVESTEELREEYLQKLEEIRKRNFIRVDKFAERYGI